MSPVAWLRARAESYARDGVALRQDGETTDAVLYETLATELRACADLLAGEAS